MDAEKQRVLKKKRKAKKQAAAAAAEPDAAGKLLKKKPKKPKKPKAPPAELLAAFEAGIDTSAAGPSSPELPPDAEPAPLTKKQRKQALKLKAAAEPSAPSSGKVASAARDTSELDDLFGGVVAAKQRKRDRAAQEADEAEAARRAAREADKRDRSAQAGAMVDPVFGESYPAGTVLKPQFAQVHRFDNASGLNVFKAHHLGLGHGGGTALCPFDCSCCF